MRLTPVSLTKSVLLRGDDVLVTSISEIYSHNVLHLLVEVMFRLSSLPARNNVQFSASVLGDRSCEIIQISWKVFKSPWSQSSEFQCKESEMYSLAVLRIGIAPEVHVGIH
jgi:hypothetical protein